MAKFEKPPQMFDFFTADLLKKALDSEALSNLLDKAQKEYVYWDKFKHYPIPEGFTPEEAWTYLKFSKRMNVENTPVKAISGKNFTYMFTKSLYQKLNYIDTNGAGIIKSLSGNPTEAQASKFIIGSLTEEAIASSQIEGANTTRKVAKEMILSQRAPRNKDEQMIVNNYRAMQKADDWKDLPMSEKILLELQEILTDQTLDNVDEGGRFRSDKDEIVVHDAVTGEIVHTPPREEEMFVELKRLIEYANTEEQEDEFIHPVIKATILHFWLAYIHPFTDGNGRSARILFYWYLLKQDYWLVQYISVSKAIKISRTAYDNAYLHSENDDNDLTYFLLYITGSFKKAIDQFLVYFEQKSIEAKELKETASKLGHYNSRQIALLKYFSSHEEGEFTEVITHQNKHGISRATANNDLRHLVKDALLVELRRGKRLLYLPNKINIKKFMKKI